MAFEISARTILHLGADLISSDAVAIYELIKNAVDAQSKNGVDVNFEVTLLAADYQTFLAEAEHPGSLQLDQLKTNLLDKLVATAPSEPLKKFRDAIKSARSVKQLIEHVRESYATYNRIIVADTGHGMSERDLREIFLKIGTTHRADAIRKALQDDRNVKTPYLGEKGVGRLSTMRLGWHLRVETATEDDRHLNILEIPWIDFENAYDKPVSSVQLKPYKGPAKPVGLKSGTRIIISDLRASWTPAVLQEISTSQIARMTDPFSWAEKRRFRIRLRYNDQIIEHTRSIAQELLKHAHAKCVGSYVIEKAGPKLTVEYSSSLHGGSPTTEEFDKTDLRAMSGVQTRGEPSSTLSSLGRFDFEIYWFNRQRLKAYEGVGDREVVRGLVKTWAGISLFRDGYRVLPYGDEGDDWLGLDYEALGASGYKLNTKQLIGRVRIGRLTNPQLLDQTNRQGLVDRPEKRVLIELLRKIVADRLHFYLNEAERAQKAKDKTEFDPSEAASRVESLEARTRATIKVIRRDYTGDQQLLQQVTDAFKELKDAHERAVDRIGTIEEEKQRMTQLAGIGLMVEIIAHELTRATEYTQGTLKSINRNKIDSETAAAFKTLEQQIRIIQRRLQILEPLTIPTRQRRVERDLGDIVAYVLEAHQAQFERHEITIDRPRKGGEPVIGFIVEGHVVQILENLIANSVYWLDLYKEDHRTFEPKIQIRLQDDPPRIRFSDNGPGIPVSRQHAVFEPFYSTKQKSASRRSGLGLYVARQNAELLGGTLDLVDEDSERKGRFNTFELTVRKEAP